MKFRNKKTGEKYEAISHEPIDIYFYNPAGRDGRTKRSYDSIADLNEEWEDYKPAEPKEPLIKDEKIRKAIRAWAEVNDIERVWHECSSNWLRGNGLMIELENEVVELEQGNYSIAELCGEEEE